MSTWPEPVLKGVPRRLVQVGAQEGNPTTGWGFTTLGYIWIPDVNGHVSACGHVFDMTMARTMARHDHSGCQPSRSLSEMSTALVGFLDIQRVVEGFPGAPKKGPHKLVTHQES